MPPQLQAWAPMPRVPLPFDSVAVISDDDPYCAIGRGRQLAADWGCRTIELRGAGHVNTATGLGDWDAGWRIVQGLAGLAPHADAASTVR